jgi:hypothetical protein
MCGLKLESYMFSAIGFKPKTRLDLGQEWGGKEDNTDSDTTFTGPCCRIRPL